MKLTPGSAQHIGARESQQDAFGFNDFANEVFTAHGGHLMVLADGMGGLANGELASRLSVETFLQTYATKTAEEPIGIALRRALEDAQQAVRACSNDPRGTGSTLVAAVVFEDRLYWISVGDSRLYLCRDDEPALALTTDHNLGNYLATLIERGEIETDVLQQNLNLEALTEYLGAPHALSPEVNSTGVLLHPGDTIILCSDGLYRILSPQETAKISRSAPAQTAAERLVAAALGKKFKYQDNVTALVLRPTPESPPDKLWHRLAGWLRLAPVVALALGVVPHPAQAQNATTLLPSVVRVLCETNSVVHTGSGFVVAQSATETDIATAAHVVSCLTNTPGATLTLFLGPQSSVPVSVAVLDSAHDLALLRAPPLPSHPPVRFARSANVQVGAPVTAIGFPAAADQVLPLSTGDDAVPTVTEGNIGRLVTASATGIGYIQHSAAINPGNSGGPLFDANGNVIGINTLMPMSATVDANTDVTRVPDGQGIGLAEDTAPLLADMQQAGLSPHVAWPGFVVWLLGSAALAVLAIGAWALRFLRTAPPASGARVRVISGELAGAQAAVTQPIILGRDSQKTDLVFPSSATDVSRHHCEISYDAATDGFKVTDLNSRNGTFVEAGGGALRRLAPHRAETLAPGDIIFIGSRANSVRLERD